jgi:hypothetical protein
MQDEAASIMQFARYLNLLAVRPSPIFFLPSVLFASRKTTLRVHTNLTIQPDTRKRQRVG